jgi:predicted enzyme related to lactoylglutathione lyase
MRIRFVSVPVSDQDRAKAFYAETLGFTVTADNPNGNVGRWIDLEIPGGGAGITLVTWFKEMPPGSMKGLVLQVDDMDASVAEWSARGLQLTSEPKDTEYGRFATFDDPDGNGWVLMEPATSN